MENNNSFYETDLEDVEDVEFTSITFIDAMRLAKDTWDNNYAFDVDPKIMEDAEPMAPAKIVSRSLQATKKNEPRVYLIWAAVKMRSVDYYVPIRFYAFADDFDKVCFKWTVAEPRNKISINAYVSNIENSEEELWSDLLD